MSFRKIIIGSLLILVGMSCSQKKQDTLFTSLPSSSTNIDFKNKLEKHDLFSILYYLYYYNGGGVATGDINNDGLTDIYFTANNKGGNKLYLNKGNFKFEDITQAAGVAGSADWCTGVTMADVNGDGFLDIYVSAVSQGYGLKGRNELFINNGKLGFSEEAPKYGLDFSGFTSQTAFFDFDHDGDLDCYILNQSHHPHANIVDTINRRKYDALSGDRLYRNDVNTAAGRFTDISAQAGIYQSNLGYGLGLAVADINNDGWDDIYIGNDFHENDYYYINNGNGSFTESGAKHFNHYSRFSMGNDIADYNNDGQLDVVTVDMLPPDEKTLKTYGSDENPDTYKQKLEHNGYQNQSSRNCLQRNNGNGNSFSEVGLMSNISATDWSWAPLFADFDNDGIKDLFISSGIVKRPVDLDYIKYVSDLKFKGMDRTNKYDDQAIDAMPEGSSHPFLFRGNAQYSFSDVSNDWGTGNMKGFFNGASYADLDNDGNLDLVVNCIDAPAVILKNTNSNKKNSISISFKGDSLNSFGIGAKAYVFQKDRMQYQQLMLTRGFQSSSDVRLHFGLDSIGSIDSILVVWPDQTFQALKQVAANKQLVISKKEAKGQFNYASYFPPKAELFNAASALPGWQHKENTFIDFNIQYLIPHCLSTRGPKIAVADVNKDGLDDFFATGAKGQSGCLMLQTKSGQFIPSDSSVFNKNRGNDEVDAVFFDANNDGSPDLYVVSGGNEDLDGNTNLADKLYMNDGKGHFSEAVGALPEMLRNKSTISVADIDKDGDIDLFVGVLANARKYGLAQSSYLLLNDGKGKFTEAAASTMHTNELGMVTSSTFTDIDKDGWPDLVVTGEWMPVKIFHNAKGVFSEMDLPQSTGLWQTIYPADINGDGNMDLLAGNWGHNSKLYAGKNGPLKMYVKDYDNNGSLEQIVAYTIDGKEYPFLAKDELERALPVLRKHYLRYAEVAGKTVQYELLDLLKGSLELKAEVLGSSCFMNDGKGGFTRMDLPDGLQRAPISTFVAGGTQDNVGNAYIAGGNFFDVIPYEGRYDAQSLAVFQNSLKGLKYDHQSQLENLKGQVRDIKWIHTSKGDQLLVARNNEGIMLYPPVGIDRINVK